MPESQRESSVNPWSILIVDDDEDVHLSTVYSLQGLQVCDQPLSFTHAYSAQQAITLLSNKSFAVILLDVVMETETSGLDLINTIRTELNLHHLQIILRTGQPGYAPEIETIAKYDINDYRAKSELTREQLFTSIASSIRAYQQLSYLDKNRNGLQSVIEVTNNLLARSNQADFSDNLLAQLSNLTKKKVSGFVCSRKEKKSITTVISTSDEYSHWDRECITVLPFEWKSNIQDCLNNKTNRILNGASYFYFELVGRDEYVLFIDDSISLEKNIIDLFSQNLSLCANNIALVKKLHNMAYDDALTQLPNRNGILKLLEAELEKKDVKMVLSIIDIEQFSIIVDTFGYYYSDKILGAVADRLTCVFQKTAIIGRIGADLFSVCYPYSSVNPESLCSIFDEPVLIEGNQHTLSVYVGSVVEQHGDIATGMMSSAMLALKRAKTAGQFKHAYFESKFLDEMKEHALLLSALKRDLDQTRLFLVYQPLMDLNTRKVSGVEALLRWKNEQGDFIAPDKFIPIAEQSGMIISLGEWVLRAALTTLAEFHKKGFPIRMAVNISAVQFQQPDFVKKVFSALSESGIPAYYLELEITESVGILGSDEIEEKLKQLKEKGVSISIDDFGTGFSSLSYLKHLSADRLKIDRSFVQAFDESEQGECIAEMIITLGKQLNLSVLAEGIETKYHLKLLKKMGCTEGQGFLFARPMEKATLLQWLKRQQ
nr:EAL domain-containing protein [Vibrio sp. Of7-15]